MSRGPEAPRSVGPDAALWAQIEPWFDTLVDLPAGEVERRIADAALAPKAEALLRAWLGEVAPSAAWFADVSAIRAAPLPRPAPLVSRETRIGAYRVLGLLGRGGMGEVYRAERADGHYLQEVALKLAHGDAAVTERAALHFHNERQILATLDHPGIARLLDGGVTADGQPYMVMELVEGDDIVAWCTSQRADLGTRLALFAQVCAAVGYAHRHLVVHRDIKPSNILVDAEGQAKLLDFGIAKLLRGGDALSPRDATVLAMTPDYAAPEQLDGRPVTTATDVYALGVLLYRLLAGTLPWNVQALPVPMVLKRLLHERPPLASAAAAGQTDPPVPPRTLQGDLDAILARALRSEPDRRYASATGLAADLARYARHQPVTARKGTRVYHAQRFLRRHRWGMSATLLLVAALSAGLAGTVWQERRAEAQAARSEAVKNFLISVFDVADPDRSKGREVTAREILDNGARRIEHELRGQPLLQSELLQTIGRLEHNLGAWMHAQTRFDEAVRLARAAPDATPAFLVEALSAAARNERQLGHYPVAQGRFEEARRIVLAGRAVDEDTLSTLDRELGQTYLDANQPLRAEPLFRAARRHDLARYGPNDERVNDDDHLLAWLATNLERYDEAAVIYPRVLAGARRLYGPDDTQIAVILNNWALVYEQTEQFRQGEALQRQALAIEMQRLGTEHDDSWTMQRNLAGMLCGQGRHAEAVALLRPVVSASVQSLGEQSEDVAYAHHHLANALRGVGDLAAAEREARLAVDGWLASVGERAIHLPSGMRTLAIVLAEQGRTDEALVWARRQLAASVQEASAPSRRVGAAYEALAAVERGAGALQQADAHAAQAEANFRGAHGDASVSLGRVLAARGAQALDQGDLPAAARRLTEALQLLRRSITADDVRAAAVLVPLGRLQAALHRPHEAESLLREALALRRVEFPAGDPRVAEVQVALCELLRDTGRRAEAGRLARETRASLSGENGQRPLAAQLRHRVDALLGA